MRCIKREYSKEELLDVLFDRFGPRDRTDALQILAMPSFRAKRPRKKNLAYALSPGKQWLWLLSKIRYMRRFQKIGTSLRHIRIGYSSYYGLTIKQLRRRLLTNVRVNFTQQLFKLEFKLPIFLYRIGLASSIADVSVDIELGLVKLNGSLAGVSSVVKVGDFVQLGYDVSGVCSRRTRSQNWRYMSFIHVEPKLRTIVLFCRPSARDLRLMKLFSLDSLTVNLIKLRF